MRALEVYFLTGRPLTAHFADTQSPLPDYDVVAFALADSRRKLTAARVAARVDAQFRQGLLDEIRGDPRCRGFRRRRIPSPGSYTARRSSTFMACATKPATRELIVRENRKYSRRQLIWFRKEPNLQWIHAAGERESTQEEVARTLAALEILPRCRLPVSLNPPPRSPTSRMCS